MSVFYESYESFKDYATPTLKAKHIRRYDSEYWGPSASTPDMKFLEIGCGMGMFLSYLKHKGVSDFLGLDLDPNLADVLPEGVKENFRVARIEDFLEDGAEHRTFNRVAMFDVLEHLTPEDGLVFLKNLSKVLEPGARVTVRIPNNASPWGAQYQYGDLTHVARYTPGSLRQLAIAAGYECPACYPCPQGNTRRLITDKIVHGILGWALLNPPEIWTANFYGTLVWPGSEA